MSNPVKNSPAKGYSTEKQLVGIVKTKTADLLRQEAINFASSRPSVDSNQILGQAGLTTGLNSSAVNQAVQAARSASEKLSGALGGKLSSVLGSGASLQAAGQATTEIRNLATGAISKVSSMTQNKLGSALQSALGSSVGAMLGSTLSQLSDTASKNLTGAKLVQGFLETGPKDSTLVTDVFGISDNNILNGVSEKISGFAKDAFNEIRRSPNLVTDLVSMVSSGGKNWALSKEGLADRIVSALGGRTGILENLSSSLKGTIVNATGLPENIYDTAVSLLGSNRVSFNAGQMNSAREVFSLINQITGSNEMKGFFDVGSESSLMSGVMREAIILGVPDAIDVLVDKAKDDQIAYNALYANMRVAVENSDLDAINLMVTKVGVNAFLSQVPDAVPLLLSRYQLPMGTTTENYDNELDALKAVLSSLRPNWGQVQRNGEWVNDLTAFCTISEDGRKLMLRDPLLQVPIIIGSTYSNRLDVIDSLHQMYPYVPLTKAA